MYSSTWSFILKEEQSCVSQGRDQPIEHVNTIAAKCSSAAFAAKHAQWHSCSLAASNRDKKPTIYNVQ